MTDEILKWIVMAIVPFSLGVLWQSWRASSSEIASQLNDLLKDLKQLEEIATEFWTTDSNEPKNSMRQARIRGLTFGLARYEEQAKLIFGRESGNYLALMDDLIETSTGGAFETSARAEDYQRAIQIQSFTSELAHIARSARRRSAGIRFATSYTSRAVYRAVASVVNGIPDCIIYPPRAAYGILVAARRRLPTLF
ncbi:hypothetical protein CO652_00620 [Rhizobium sp. H4]|uniref:hypothetical protein n=1 Tax=Rhizobium sp. H4 TaxID=2035449 RepID=UPI000BE87D12|nr:hypothetical protein [Rhizobium sp. H4]PDV89957.1 hypothetical protein CO652_00620 [Rhizobium sp. H4]